MTIVKAAARGVAALGVTLVVGTAAGEARGTGRDDASLLVEQAPVEQAPAVSAAEPASSVQRVRDDAALGSGFTAPPAAESEVAASEVAAATAGARASRGDDASLPTVTAALAAPKAAPAAPGPDAKAGSGKPYAAHVARHARAAGVPVELALAVVRVESNFNPKARGRAGEIGLMQIKPQTARGMGFSGSASALYDPETNLKWGMMYLAGAYKRAGGDTCGTILRYQGGHYARRMTAAASAYCGKVKRHMDGRWA